MIIRLHIPAALLGLGAGLAVGLLLLVRRAP